jgi:hypothetical protein
MLSLWCFEIDTLETLIIKLGFFLILLYMVKNVKTYSKSLRFVWLPFNKDYYMLNCSKYLLLILSYFLFNVFLYGFIVLPIF